MPESFCFYKRILFVALFLIFSISSSFAQLSANFSGDKNGGCSPLTVSFTNTTTGASSNATYKWDFGNGNSSSLANAGATYVLEQTYTVTLTVTDESKSSSQTKQITVYKRPTVDFSFDVVKGCLTLPVNFTAIATAGDGSIANYFWDFGDGSTQEISTPQIQHIYNLAQKINVGLTVTNSFGCYTSVQKPATQVLSAIQANFTADSTILCNISDAVNFKNLSSGPGTLSYSWNFGDGSTSTAPSPSHVYNKKGTYSISLTVTNADGCKNSTTQSNYVNVRNFFTDFSVPQLICKTVTQTFTDSSTAGANSKLWLVDGLGACNWCNYGTFNYSFYDSLSHTIQLINTYGNCRDTAMKQLTVKNIPNVQPFVVSIPQYCDVPVTVVFKDTTKDAVKWLWNFDAYDYYNSNPNTPSSSLQAPTYTYNQPAYSYDVLLTVTNAAGCSSTINENVPITPVGVIIGTANSNSYIGCDSVSVDYMASVTPIDTIVSYQWDFGDGTISALPLPHHTYTKAGTFTATLKYLTKHGCSGTATSWFSAIVQNKIPFDFDASSTTICGNTPVNFTTTGGGGGYYQWDFGDGGAGYSTEYYTNATHQYLKDSLYSVTLVINNYYWGLCPDTLTKQFYIKVLPPFPKILSAQNTCDGLRNIVTFKDTSYKALTWDWDFGDGSTHFTSNDSQVISHTYAATGAYKVVLTNSNGQCSVRDSTIVYVLLKQNPVLSANVASACANGVSTIYLNNMQTNPAPSPYFWYGNYYGLFAMQYGDSTSYAYNGYPFQNGAWQNAVNWTITDLDPTKKDLRIISTSAYFGCNDTSNYIPFKINGPKAGFELTESNPCFAYPV